MLLTNDVWPNELGLGKNCVQWPFTGPSHAHRHRAEPNNIIIMLYVINKSQQVFLCWARFALATAGHMQKKENRRLLGPCRVNCISNYIQIDLSRCCWGSPSSPPGSNAAGVAVRSVNTILIRHKHATFLSWYVSVFSFRSFAHQGFHVPFVLCSPLWQRSSCEGIWWLISFIFWQFS